MIFSLIVFTALVKSGIREISKGGFRMIYDKSTMNVPGSSTGIEFSV